MVAVQALEDGAPPQTPLKSAPGALQIQEDLQFLRRARQSDAEALEDGALPQAPLKTAFGALGQIQEDLPFPRRTRRDALPEHTQYADTGCEVHHSCLTCPLVRCRYDEPGGARRLLSEGRDRQIVALRRSGDSINQIARRFGVSRRTVFRALARSLA